MYSSEKRERETLTETDFIETMASDSDSDHHGGGAAAMMMMRARVRFSVRYRYVRTCGLYEEGTRENGGCGVE